MKNNWDDREISGQASELDLCVYASHLLGREKTLVLPGFGSTSVKVTTDNIFGEAEEILWISPSEQDLGKIVADDLIPLHNSSLTVLTKLQNLTQEQYENALLCSRVKAANPLPALEAIAHAVLPNRYVFYVCPDALQAITNTANRKERLREIYHATLLVLECTRLDFPLAKALARALNASNRDLVEGILILGQGLFTFGDDAKETYSRMVRLVSQAEEYLLNGQAEDRNTAPLPVTERPLCHELPSLRQAISDLAGFPVLLCMDHDPLSLRFCQREDLHIITQQGPVTPAQVATIKLLPMLKQDLEAHRDRIEQDPHRYGAGGEKIDAAPRVILDPELGMLTIGCTAKEARQVAEVYLHAIQVILNAHALGEYQPFPAHDVLGVEDFKHKLSLEETTDKANLFIGEIALVTGGASGIGKACVESLLARGAAVVSMDINPLVKNLYDCPDYLGLECDLTNEQAVIQGFETLVRTFGGLDMLVLNAGIFPAGVRIESLGLSAWQKVMRINLDSYLTVMREAYPLLKCSPRGGRVLLNASKNVLAPGEGAAAYSSSKAAVTQLARIAALEWGKDHIRINMIHPDAIFDTGIWTEEVLKARAAYYGLTVQQYKTRNVLGVELNSHYVGELIAEMLGPLFEKITGAQIPVDGGSNRVI